MHTHKTESSIYTVQELYRLYRYNLASLFSAVKSSIFIYMVYGAKRHLNYILNLIYFFLIVRLTLRKKQRMRTDLFGYRRPVRTEEELLVFIWSRGPLEFFDASPTLQPFSYFQYRVQAHNPKGSVLSQWALAQTLQAEPQDMAPPTVTPTGEFTKSHENAVGT